MNCWFVLLLFCCLRRFRCWLVGWTSSDLSKVSRKRKTTLYIVLFFNVLHLWFGSGRRHAHNENAIAIRRHPQQHRRVFLVRCIFIVCCVCFHSLRYVLFLVLLPTQLPMRIFRFLSTSSLTSLSVCLCFVFVVCRIPHGQMTPMKKKTRAKQPKTNRITA